VDNTNPQYGGVYNNRKLLNVLFADSHVAIMKGSDFCDKTNQLSNSDKTATVQNLRWNSP
jgi:prepilin-type processing-associated H-X9-DG protein